MNRLAQEAVIVGLARRLDQHGSWCGETHLQKAAFIARAAFSVDFDFDFILYKQGPFSFELQEDLESMRADRLLERVPQPAPFGPRLLATERGKDLEARLERVMLRYGPILDQIAHRFGPRRAVELERIATALWVTNVNGGPIADRARALAEIKPQVQVADATRALSEIDEILAEAKGTSVAA